MIDEKGHFYVGQRRATVHNWKNFSPQKKAWYQQYAKQKASKYDNRFRDALPFGLGRSDTLKGSLARGIAAVADPAINTGIINPINTLSHLVVNPIIGHMHKGWHIPDVPSLPTSEKESPVLNFIGNLGGYAVPLKEASLGLKGLEAIPMLSKLAKSKGALSVLAREALKNFAASTLSAKKDRLEAGTFGGMSAMMPPIAGGIFNTLSKPSAKALYPAVADAALKEFSRRIAPDAEGFIDEKTNKEIPYESPADRITKKILNRQFKSRKNYENLYDAASNNAEGSNVTLNNKKFEEGLISLMESEPWRSAVGRDKTYLDSLLEDAFTGYNGVHNTSSLSGLMNLRKAINNHGETSGNYDLNALAKPKIKSVIDEVIGNPISSDKKGRLAVESFNAANKAYRDHQNLFGTFPAFPHGKMKPNKLVHDTYNIAPEYFNKLLKEQRPYSESEGEVPFGVRFPSNPLTDSTRRLLRPSSGENELSRFRKFERLIGNPSDVGEVLRSTWFGKGANKDNPITMGDVLATAKKHPSGIMRQYMFEPNEIRGLNILRRLQQQKGMKGKFEDIPLKFRMPEGIGYLAGHHFMGMPGGAIGALGVAGLSKLARMRGAAVYKQLLEEGGLDSLDKIAANRLLDHNRYAPYASGALASLSGIAGDYR